MRVSQSIKDDEMLHIFSLEAGQLDEPWKVRPAFSSRRYAHFSRKREEESIGEEFQPGSL